MWWISLAWAGMPQPTWLSDTTACFTMDPFRAEPMPGVTAHTAAWLGAIGVPEGVARLRFSSPPNCCGPLRVELVSSVGGVLGTMELSDDCTLLRFSIPTGQGTIPSFPLPVGTTPASAIVAAWPSLVGDARWGDAVVGWPEGLGFRVDLVRNGMSIVQASVGADRTIGRIGRVVQPFVAPPDAMARTAEAFGLKDEPRRDR